MNALMSLTNKEYRHDILSGNMVQYIISQFRKARRALGNTPVEEAEELYEDRNKTMFRHTLQSLSFELPSVINQDFASLKVLISPQLYCTAAVLLQSSTPLTLTIITTLNQSSTIIRWSSWDTSEELKKMRRNIGLLQELDDMRNAKNAVQDGTTPYPNEKYKKQTGMAFELRNISFSYPGDSSTKKALDNVNFRIPSGQLVVIVGVNGSGKSSFLNLLTRMYDVSSGQLLVDGEEIRTFKLSDFRRATATLTQNHRLLPLSIAENIALGNPEGTGDITTIKDAARRGGCEGLIEKLEGGYETVLDKKTTQYRGDIDEDNKDDLLTQEVRKLDKTKDVSGGERQRLVAARTFMRLNSPKVKFVAIDEPSSALDPEGELHLFNNLRDSRNGRTMLFVTHRFGPITKHADLIICMKNGRIVESGTHTELMRMSGEYRKMFDIQAKPFDADT
ncbi:hypothetical protein V5O48_018651 [Marasmius crinis-equi]|uniref:ABC transporter domain-containing protein n=1 Tax=Marasmius crinis-equi TaxID=585013 RepID=A0ABR3EKN6_9AGAR